MCSSVVERYVDIVEVISSILITPTKKLIILSLKDNLAIYKKLYWIYTLWAWRLLRRGNTRSHSELGSQALQRRWYFVLRHGRVGRCQAKKLNIFMKVVSSLKSHKKRDMNSKLVRRRGRIYIINKKNPKYKARQR